MQNNQKNNKLPNSHKLNKIDTYLANAEKNKHKTEAEHVEKSQNNVENSVETPSIQSFEETTSEMLTSAQTPTVLNKFVDRANEKYEYVTFPPLKKSLSQPSVRSSESRKPEIKPTESRKISMYARVTNRSAPYTLSKELRTTEPNFNSEKSGFNPDSNSGIKTQKATKDSPVTSSFSKTLHLKNAFDQNYEDCEDFNPKKGLVSYCKSDEEDEKSDDEGIERRQKIDVSSLPLPMDHYERKKEQQPTRYFTQKYVETRKKCLEITVDPSGENFIEEKSNMTEEDLSMFHKTRICTYYAQGFCVHGADCKYAHGENDKKSSPLKVKQSGERGLTSNEDLYGFNLIPTRVQPDQIHPTLNLQAHVPLIQEPQGQFMVTNPNLQQNMQNPANLQQIQNALQFPNMLPNIANQQQSQQLTAIQQQLSAFMNLFQQQALPSMDYRSMPIFNHINPAVMQIPGVPNPSVPNPVVPNPAILTANAVVPNLMNSTPISSPSKLPMPARLQSFNHELTSSFSRENIAENLPENEILSINRASIPPNTNLKYFNTNLPSSDIQIPDQVQHTTHAVSDSKTSSMQIYLTDDCEDDDQPFFGEPSIDENTSELVTGDFCQDLFKYIVCDEWREAVIKMNQILEVDSLQKFLQFNFDQLKREMSRERGTESKFSLGEILTLKFCQNEYKMNKMKSSSEVK